ncbi:MAG: glutamate synthase large subunit [Polyangiaceae bacterium]|nr:glutamate synthase large subunit [Polyangiaceae bacterium]MCW5790955.1 glutamate synthase large subunit [Polyangiaceae bacterium]
MPLPNKSGLYDPRFEHDACGVGFVANIHGQASHHVVRQGVQILLNLVHRGAAGCDPLTGDGAGILIQVPDAFLRREASQLGFELPPPGEYGVGCVFLPQSREERRRCMQIVEDKIAGTGQRLLGWRDVPVDEQACGPLARESAPVIKQVFIGTAAPDPQAFERKLFVIRRWIERTVRESELRHGQGCYIPSLSSRILIYKGLLHAEQLAAYYLDLNEEAVVSALAMVHQRFSTNTFPTWELAQPFRNLAHNGEINTLRGNVAWMHARETLFAGEVFGDDIRHILPVVTPGGSDSAALDNVAEMLLHAGRSLPHVMMMLVPEAWQNDPEMPALKRDFYAYHSCLMEPWDGPAALTFTDGRQIGAMLDRNGLRPARWTLTKGGTVVLGSETGVLEFAPEEVLQKGRLEPGKMLLVDLEQGRIIDDSELKGALCARQPYGKWLRDNKINLGDIEEVPSAELTESRSLGERQRAFGYTKEDLQLLLAPMAQTGQEAVGSMGTDTPLAALSDEPQLLFNYFKQHFAQVTNPAIDPIREEMVMSLSSYIGGEGNLLFELPDQAQMLELPHPILTDRDLAKLRGTHLIQVRVPATLPMLYPVSEGAAGLKASLDELCRQASVAVLNGHSLIILSDRGVSPHMAPIPSLLATGAVHHHLTRNGTRVKVGILVETGEAREVSHFALLAGYGAGGVNPYLALESVRALCQSGALPGVTDPRQAEQRYIKAVCKGLLKVMSKMGISTLQSYQGAQLFEAIGLSEEVIDRYFTGTASRLSGVDLAVIAEEASRRHRAAFSPRAAALSDAALSVGGQYHYRAQGELHLWNPQTIAALQRAVRQEDLTSYREYADWINLQSQGHITLRGLWELEPKGTPIALSEVEPASEIVKRFATGAMSFGSISAEAHENLALAMNSIGGRSNTGEGGEQPERALDARRSSIKQVASGRFGVTTHYLVSADELQIKISQGAKPGEGGQLPGHKVDEIIAKTRHSTPGVTLISPPPHHDIYSIEDLAQLIFDLKMVNPKARISVKLVAEAGVGTVAAGVAKAHADVILISGHDGGTGASPLTSIKHAGVPWELGLAETHQVLAKNDLRGRVVLQADGQLRTGRDVAIACLLGAEEFGFATAPLVASGCIMMRKCHLNTCPVGIATQDPVLRRKFTGQPEHVVSFMFFVAEELRALMAQLGFRRLSEMVGRTDYLKVKESSHWKASRLDFTDVLAPAAAREGIALQKQTEQDHGLERAYDQTLLPLCEPALADGQRVELTLPVQNVHRTVGAMLAGEVARRRGAGLPEGSIVLRFTGSAGQSFGAFAVSGMELHLEGDANDYLGKGLTGGALVVRPPRGSSFRAEENVIIGNTALYGATSGSAFISGRAGERFAVRNSGAQAVVEGVGDHGCEYMTGGLVVILGPTGRNFGAGMSGGLAFVYDPPGALRGRCNLELVTLTALSGDDAAELARLLERHAALTGSPLAKSLLATWEASLQHFVKVFPIEYQRALARREEERARRVQAEGVELDDERSFRLAEELEMGARRAAAPPPGATASAEVEAD